MSYAVAKAIYKAVSSDSPDTVLDNVIMYRVRRTE
jgi:hypothetical protein